MDSQNTKPCPCGSGRPSSQCCLPTIPPLSINPGLQIGPMSTNLVVGRTESGMDLNPRLRQAIEAKLKVSMTLYDPVQLDADTDRLVFEELLQPIARLLESTMVSQDNMFKELGNLRLALNAIRYHQRQFLWRWTFLRTKYLLARHRPADTRTEVRVDDFPLRFELQSLVMAADSCMDVTWRFICVLNGKDPEKNHQRYRQFVEKHPKDFPTLHPAVMARKKWFLKLIALRNAVAHEGALEDLSGFGYNGQELLNPLIGAINAQHFGIQLWVDVHSVVSELIQSAIKDVMVGSTGN